MRKNNSNIERILSEDASIKKLLNDKNVSRRDFLTYTGALGMSVAMGSSLWSSKAMAESPTRGGHLKAGLVDFNTNATLDASVFLSTPEIVINRAYRDSIVDVGVDGSASPALAESWEASSDAKTWRFKVRKGVEFSNGKSLTAEDILHSINVHRGEDSTSAATGIFSGIVDVKVDGKDTVVVSMSDANADAPFLFTDYHFSVAPSKDGKSIQDSKHGTGAYLLKEFEPGIKAVVEKNPNAWNADITGWVDSAEVIGIQDGTARQSALISGSVDVIDRPALKTVERLKRVKNIRIVEAPSNLAFDHPMRMDTVPFDNNDFRLALKYSTPRQEFIDKVLFGYGVLGNDQPLGPKFQSHDASLKSEYDLDKAKFHLKKAGLEGAEFDLSAADTAYGGAVDAAQIFQQHWQKIGLKPNIIREPQDGYWSSVWNVKPFCAAYWGARPVEDMILSLAYLSTSPWNDTVLESSRVDELIVAARGELSQVKRKDMYGEIQQIIHSTGGALIPAFGVDVAATNNTIAHGQIGGGWEMDGGHFIKRWWKTA